MATEDTFSSDIPTEETTKKVDPIYRFKDGRFATKKQILADGITEDEINAGLNDKLITQIGDTEDVTQQFKYNGQIITAKDLFDDQFTADNIATNIAEGLLIPIEKKNQVPSTSGLQDGALVSEYGTFPIMGGRVPKDQEPIPGPIVEEPTNAADLLGLQNAQTKKDLYSKGYDVNKLTSDLQNVDTDLIEDVSGAFTKDKLLQEYKENPQKYEDDIAYLNFVSTHRKAVAALPKEERANFSEIYLTKDKEEGKKLADKINQYGGDYKRELLNNLSKMTGDEYKFLDDELDKESTEKGSRLGYIYNSFLNGIGSVSSGASDVMMQILTTVLPEKMIGGTKEEALAQWRNEVEPITRTAMSQLIGADVGENKQRKYEKEFWTSAIGGLAGSVPMMVSPYGTGLFLGSYDAGLQSINNTEEGKKLPESTKSIFAVGVGLAGAALEKVGLDKIFGKQSKRAAIGIASKTISDLLEKSTAPITKEVFEAALNANTKTIKQKIISAGGKIGKGVSIEAITGGSQEAANVVAEKLLNASQKKEVFQPQSMGEVAGRVLYAARQEGVGGGLLGGLSAFTNKTRNYISEKVAEAKTPEDIQKIKNEVIVQFQNNRIQRNETDQLIKLVDDYANINSKVPENVENRKEVINTISERDEIKTQIDAKQQELNNADDAFKPELQKELDALQGRYDELNEEAVAISKGEKPVEETTEEQKFKDITEIPFIKAQIDDLNNRINSPDAIDAEKARQELDLLKKDPISFFQKRKDDAIAEAQGVPKEKSNIDKVVEEYDNIINKIKSIEQGEAVTPKGAEAPAVLDPAILKLGDKIMIDGKERTVLSTFPALEQVLFDDGSEHTFDEIRKLAQPTKKAAEAAPSVLKDVESTAKALESVDITKKFSPTNPEDKVGNARLLAEQYHKDKAAGEETDLTKAVEELLAPTKEAAPTPSVEVEKTPEQVTQEQLSETELLLSGEAEKRRQEGGFVKDGVEYKRNEKGGGEKGNSGEVRFTNEVSLPFKYKLIEAEALQPSHQDGIRNPLHFIPEAQPKNRNDAGSLAAEESFANNPRFDELGENTNAYSGAPVVNERNEVVQGNNRSAGLRKGYNRGNKQYREALAQNAEKFGFTKEQVEGMKNPVLVREVATSDAGAIELGNYDVKDLETGGKRRLDPVAITRRLPFNIKGRLSEIFKGDETINEALRNNTKRVFDILSPYLNQAQRNTIFKDGKLTEAGAKDMEAVVQHLLFDGGDVALPDLFENLTHTQKEGLRKALPYIFSTTQEKSIIPEIQEAILALNHFTQSKAGEFDAWLAQTDMFNESRTPRDIYSPIAIEIAKKLNDAKSQKEVSKIFGEYANEVNDKPATMFEEAQAGLSKAEGIKKTFKVEYDETKKPTSITRGGGKVGGEPEAAKPKPAAKPAPEPAQPKAKPEPTAEAKLAEPKPEAKPISEKAQNLRNRLKLQRKEVAPTGEAPSVSPPKVYTLKNIKEIDASKYSGAAKEVVKGIANMMKAVGRITKKFTGEDVSVQIHESPESYRLAVLEAGGTEADINTKGLYIDSKNTVHLNITEVTPDTGAHELFHPVLDYMIENNPQILQKFVDQLGELPNGQEIISKNQRTYAQDGIPTQNKEAIVDYIAQVASGQIKLDKSTFQQVKDFVINALNALGINVSAKLNTVQDLQKLAQQISRQFKTGQELKGKEIAKEKETGIQPSRKKPYELPKSNKEISESIKKMRKQYEDEFDDAVYNWNESEVVVDYDGNIKFKGYVGRDRQYSRGKEGGSYTPTKRDFISWLFSEKPFDPKTYKIDESWTNTINKLRSVLTKEKPPQFSRINIEEELKKYIEEERASGVPESEIKATILEANTGLSEARIDELLKGGEPQEAIYVEPKRTIFSHRGLQEVATEFGLDDVGPRERKRDATLFQEVDDILTDWQEKGTYNKNIEKLFEKAKNKLPFGEQENLIMAQHIAQLREQGAMARKEFGINSPEYNKKLKEINEAIRLAESVRSQQGAALRVPIFARTYSATLEDAMTTKMEALEVDELLPEQKAEVEKLYNEIEKTRNEFNQYRAEAEKKFADMQAEIELNKLKSEAAKTKKPSKNYAEDRKSYIQQLKSAVEEYKAAGRKMGIAADGGVESFVISAKIAKIILKIVGTHVGETGAKLNEVVDKTLNDVKDIFTGITDRDIRDIIAGKYAEKKETYTDLMADMRSLKSEQVLLDEYNNLMRGGTPTDVRRAVRRNQRLSELRQQIDAIKKEKRLGRFSEEEMADRIIEANKKRIEEINKKIANKDFEKTAKPKTFWESEEFKRNNPELYRKILDSYAAKEEAQVDFDIAILKDQESKKTKFEKTTDWLGALANTTKKIVTGIDDSALFMQTLASYFARPIIGTKAFKEHVLDAFSKKRYERKLAELQNSPHWDLIVNSGLDVTKPTSLAQEKREETFSGKTLDVKFKFKGKEYKVLDKLLSPFERAFTSLGNNMRAMAFITMSDRLKREGYTFEKDPKVFKDLAQMLNTETGRGKLNENVQKISDFINKGIWSPRLMASRLNMLGISDLISVLLPKIGTKGYYRQLDPKIRKMAVRDTITFTTSILVTSYLLAYAFGGEVDDDPTSSTYLDIKMPDGKSYNISGGFAQYIRLIAQTLAGGKTKEGKFEEFKGQKDRGSNILRFFRGKLTPIAGAAVDLLTGKDFMGQPVTLAGEVKKLAIPISLQGVADAIQQDGISALYQNTLPSFFGISVKDEKNYPSVKIKTKSKGLAWLEGNIELPNIPLTNSIEVNVDDKHPEGKMTEEEQVKFKEIWEKEVVKNLDEIYDNIKKKEEENKKNNKPKLVLSKTDFEKIRRKASEEATEATHKKMEEYYKRDKIGAKAEYSIKVISEKGGVRELVILKDGVEIGKETTTTTDEKLIERYKKRQSKKLSELNKIEKEK